MSSFGNAAQRIQHREVGLKVRPPDEPLAVVHEQGRRSGAQLFARDEYVREWRIVEAADVDLFAWSLIRDQAVRKAKLEEEFDFKAVRSEWRMREN